MKSLWFAILLSLAGITMAHAAVVAKDIDYTVDGTAMKGYIAYDDSIKGQRPGVLVVHEWWGLNDYARKRARMLAELGYTAFALDMYGAGKQAHHPDDASKFSGEVMKNLPMAQARFRAALDLLRQDKTVDPRRIAAIGYCFGGAIALEMARSGMDLVGVASFHGMLDTANPAKPGAVKGKVLVLHGADDPFVPTDQVAKFKKEMDAAKVDYKFIAYPGAKHAFTNPDATEYGTQFNLPLAYNKDADQASWKEMRGFFKQIFKKR